MPSSNPKSELLADLIELKSFATAMMSLEETAHGPTVTVLHCELNYAELNAPKSSLTGWRMAANDCIEMSIHWTAERVKRVDAALTKAGIVTLSEIRRRFWAKYRKLLARGEIRSEIEYYMVAALLADQSIDLSSSEQSVLESMVTRFCSGAA